MNAISDQKTEAAVLASIMTADCANQALGAIGDNLPAPRGRWFTSRPHRVLAWALDAAAEGHCDADGMSVMDWLGRQPGAAVRDHLTGKRAFAGYGQAQPGDTAADELRGELPMDGGTGSMTQLRTWAERLRRLGDAREALQTAEAMVNAITTAPLDLASAVGDSVARLHRLAAGGAQEQDLGTAMRGMLSGEAGSQESDARWGFGPMDGSESGIRFVRGEMTVLAAPSGGGKTSLMLQSASATAAALGTEAVAIASLEMPTATLASIIGGRMAGIPAKWIRSNDPRITHQQRVDLEAIAQHWTDSRSMLCRDNTVGPDARSLDAILGWIRYRAMASGGKLQLAIIDHMHLIAKPQRASSIDWIEQCSGQIKACAASLNIPILVLAQMTKEGARAIKDTKTGKVTGTPEPVMQDLRGAAALGNDAAQIVFVHDEQAGMDKQDEERRVRILVRKNRYGACRGYDAVFVAPQQAFVEPVLASLPTRNAHISEEQRAENAEEIADRICADAF